MPRKDRHYDPDSYYHIAHRGTGRRIVFEDRPDYLMFEGLMIKAKYTFNFDLYNYSLMPNHVHMLIRPNGANFSVALHQIFNTYTKRHHQRHKQSGHLWQERNEPTLIEDDAHLYNSGFYIELNPVRAGLIHSPIDWEFSSCRHYCGVVQQDFITQNPLIGALGITTEEKKARYFARLQSHFPNMIF